MSPCLSSGRDAQAGAFGPFGPHRGLERRCQPRLTADLLCDSSRDEERAEEARHAYVTAITDELVKSVTTWRRRSSQQGSTGDEDLSQVSAQSAWSQSTLACSLAGSRVSVRRANPKLAALKEEHTVRSQISTAAASEPSSISGTSQGKAAAPAPEVAQVKSLAWGGARHFLREMAKQGKQLEEFPEGADPADTLGRLSLDLVQERLGDDADEEELWQRRLVLSREREDPLLSCLMKHRSPPVRSIAEDFRSSALLGTLGDPNVTEYSATGKSLGGPSAAQSAMGVSMMVLTVAIGTVAAVYQGIFVPEQ